MRKVFRYLRSMRFGLLLLGLIGLCSVIGTVIPQGREIAWYAQTYRSFHGVILLLRLNRIFESPYFIALLILLCLNLSLCSLLRIRTVVTAAKTETQRAARAPDTVLLTPEGAEKLRQYLTDMRCKSETIGEATVWRKHGIGRYGTFVTHLSILLTVVFGALALYTPTVVDRDCMPGESIFLDDGTEIHVHDFRIADETGRLDYRSHVQVTLPDGTVLDSGTRSVDLRDKSPAECEALAPKLALLPALKSVRLGSEGGAHTWESLARLRALLPEPAFKYSFQLYGKECDLSDPSLNLSHIAVPDGGAELRARIPLMTELNYVDMDVIVLHQI